MRASSSFRRLPALFAIVYSFFWSCSLLDQPLQFGSPRKEDRSGNSGSGSGKERQDTLLLVSAVDFPESYDWQRDSACGKVSCTLRLFRGGQEALGIPAGPGTTVSSAPDGHHIINRDLYTIYTGTEGTFIGANGIGLAHWDDREYIVGLYPSGNDIYTLGQSFGGGIAFRCNGREFFRDPEGIPLGGFGSDTYGPTGALYSDGESICFAYRRKQDDKTEIVFMRDGEQDGPPIRLTCIEVLDAKYISGDRTALYEQSGHTRLFSNGKSVSLTEYRGVRWTDASLISLGGRTCVAGQCFMSSSHSEGWGIGYGYELNLLDGSPEHLYFDGDVCLPLDLDDYPGCRFMGRSCACAIGGSLAVALTPRDESIHPYVTCKGVRQDYPVHGFLSGVAFQLPE
ncbi:MAG: hypothetical protein J5737_07305 [Bacteroidales bacterium]|nr:hypothetical protein [Bacteroidales bacterium]